VKLQAGGLANGSSLTIDLLAGEMVGCSVA
jgi:hypothetical protein